MFQMGKFFTFGDIFLTWLYSRKMSPFAALLKDFMVEIDQTRIVGWSFLYKGLDLTHYILR